MAQLSEDLALIKIPYELFTGMTIVTDELEKKGFTYIHMINNDSVSLVFKSEKEEINVIIEKETLLVRQYRTNEGRRKLTVIYVVSPNHRNFKLITNQ